MIKRCNPLAVLVSFNTDVNRNCMHDINFALKIKSTTPEVRSIEREGVLSTKTGPGNASEIVIDSLFF